MKKPKRDRGCNLCEARRKTDDQVFCMVCGFVRFSRKQKKLTGGKFKCEHQVR